MTERTRQKSYPHPMDAVRHNAIAATIERCAQVADDWQYGSQLRPKSVAAAIRALAAKDPNLIYPGKDQDFVFPEE